MKKIAAIGEVLFDRFNEKEVIGGAPFNFIYHISRFIKMYDLGYKPGFITKIGNDPHGKIVEETFHNINLQTDLLQVSGSHYTGLVNATINAQGIADYEIVEHSAYDYIDFTPATKAFLTKDICFFYYGTLFQRSQHNRQTLLKCLPEENMHACKVFFDINLRQDYFNWEIIDSSLLQADYLKINAEELHILKNKYFTDYWFHYDDEFIEFLLKEYVIDVIILTKGKKGATIYHTDGGRWDSPAQISFELKDTIGAGDAFSAIFAIGTLLKWPMTQILERAIRFSSEICKIEGAIPSEEEWYGQFQSWFQVADNK